MISLLNLFDDCMCYVKFGQWWENNFQCGLVNNFVFYIEKFDVMLFMCEWMVFVESGLGECGVFNCQVFKVQVVKNNCCDFNYDFGINFCSEIIL